MGATNRNLLITMVLGGLWHGAAWTFVAWGAYHGVLLIVASRARGTVRSRLAVRPSRRRLAAPSAWLVMIHLTCYGWLLFRAVGLDEPDRLHVSESA